MNNLSTKSPNYVNLISHDKDYHFIENIKNNPEFTKYYSLQILAEFQKIKNCTSIINNYNESKFIFIIKEIRDDFFGLIINGTNSCLIVKGENKLFNLINLIESDTELDPFEITSIYGINSKRMVHISRQGEVSTNF